MGVPSGRDELRPLARLLTSILSRRGGILPIEGAPPISSEGPEPDVLAGFVVELAPVVATAPLGGPDMDPAGGPVDRSGIARCFDERFDQNRCGAVPLGPVCGQAPADDGEDVRTEVGDPDPGQDQEPRVADTWRILLEYDGIGS